MDEREHREDGPAPVPVSLRSSSSIQRWDEFKGDPGPQILQNFGPSNPGPESVCSDRSMVEQILFRTKLIHHRRGGSDPGPESLLSDGSKGEEQERCSYPRTNPELRPQHHLTQLDSIFKLLQEDILSFVQEELKKLHKVLSADYPECLEPEEDEDREAFLKITVNFLRRRQQEDLAEHLWSRRCSGVLQRNLKRDLQQKCRCVFEGVAKAGSPALLQQIYTELYITEGGASEVNQEHEVRLMETASRKPGGAESAITSADMFKRCSHTLAPVRTVLTVGVAGIGKTLLTQKVSLDWAEGRALQDVQLLFPFTFRALNVLRDKSISLVQLLRHFFRGTENLHSFKDLQLLFILDGLDECRVPLDFSRTRVLTEPTEHASLEELLVNLIRGSLLPSARLWITTRPAAANQIPVECVSMVTEVQGFSEVQKEQYFRKRFTDEAVISHIRSVRSLFIMCYIPVFCWILSVVLQKLLEQTEEPELPQTLTEMYVHFLVVQAKFKNIKYHEGTGADLHWTQETREMLRSLGKLAFEQLLKGNLIFYESDLKECGLDAEEIARYSGVFTQVFREEPGLYQDTVYCFIHLSVQEFLAALHVHQTFVDSGVNLLSTKTQKSTRLTVKPNLKHLHRSAVDQALQSPNGHLDLFLRFLLGLSLPTNQRLLLGLLTPTGSGSRTNQKTAEYIKQKLSEEASAERSLNLLHCLNELKDGSLVEQVQQLMSSGRLSEGGLSPAQWSALAFILLSSEEALEQFELQNYSASEEALLRLLPVVKASNKALLSSCNLSESSCGALSSILSSSSLTVLDLSNNGLKDSGLEMFSVGLKSPQCKLQQLRLSGCNLSESSCGTLSSVLSSSSLTVLDLSNNDLKDSGLEMFSVGLTSPQCKLQQLRLSGCLISEEGCAALTSALRSSPSSLTLLDLSFNHPGATGVKQLTALQEDPHCSLHTLRLEPAGAQWLTPGLKKYRCPLSLDPNTAQKELKLSNNNKKVTCVSEEQPYPDHPDRFDHWPQLLCGSALTGRCYWEVRWSGGLFISVSDRGIIRKGDGVDSMFGGNDQSWSLSCSKEGFYVCHQNKQTSLPQPRSSSSSSGTVAKSSSSSGTVAKSSSSSSGTVAQSSGTVAQSSGTVAQSSGTVAQSSSSSSGTVAQSSSSSSGTVAVYVDRAAGSLSFYTVSSERLIHLHSFSTSFTEPPLPGFMLCDYGSSVSLLD